MTDIEIARKTKTEPITNIAKKLGIKPNELICYGSNKAKINAKPKKKKAKLILVTAINPTIYGEGKTTVSIGLADAIKKSKKNVSLALREPSLGPVFGTKGGATGGGYSQVVPMEDINLHFTGDFHAITSANNLLCATIDNAIFQKNPLKINPEKIFFKRCLDLNDRALRKVTVGQSNEKETPREDNFTITAASEIMAIMSLASDFEELKTMLGNILVAMSTDNKPIYARDLNVNEAMAILLKDAFKPNLVQTLEGTPCLMHCGPFANIAHGCNSIVATNMAMGLSDYVVTEAGFGSDLGAEKFLDVKCRKLGVIPNCVVLVVTVRAVKVHGGQLPENMYTEDYDSLNLGLPLIKKHIENITNVFKLPCVVAINKFVTDQERELQAIKTYCEDLGVKAYVSNTWEQGGKGALELAAEVIKTCQNSKEKMNYAYEIMDSVKGKIQSLTTKIYGAKKVEYSDKAKESLKLIAKLGMEELPIVVAKTQYSLSDNPKMIGHVDNFTMLVNDIEVKTGAGFIVVVMGNMMLMPGLAKNSAYETMTIKDDIIEGLF